MTLFVPGIRADNPQAAATLHRAAVHADLLDGCLDFHESKKLYAARDTRPSSVRIELHLHAIANEDFYPMQTHLTGQVREHNFSTLQLDTEKSVRKSLFDDSFNKLRFRHICAKKNSK